MSLLTLVKIQLKHMLSRKEFAVISTICILIVCISFIELCSHFTAFEYDALPIASYAWIGNMDAMQIQAIHVWYYLFFFLLSASVYADALLLDSTKGTVNFIAIRTNRWKLVASYTIAAFIGGLIVIVIPLLISQLLSCVVFPISGQDFGFQTMINEGIHLDNLQEYISKNVLFPYLYYNQTYLLNIIYILYSGLIAGLVSSITFAISLHIKVKRLVLIGAPSIVIVSCAFLIPRNYQIQFYMFPSASLIGLSPTYFALAPVVLLILLVSLLVSAHVLRRDYLL